MSDKRKNQRDRVAKHRAKKKYQKEYCYYSFSAYLGGSFVDCFDVIQNDDIKFKFNWIYCPKCGRKINYDGFSSTEHIANTSNVDGIDNFA